MELSIIVPVFNEEKILNEAMGIISKVFDKCAGKGKWKFVFINNNSTDNSANIIQDLIAKNPGSEVHIEYTRNYGAAIKNGINRVDTDWFLVIDVEQWDIPFLNWSWNNRNSHDLFIGSKRADITLNSQSNYRYFLSWGLNSLIQLFFTYPGMDTHGSKLVRTSSVKDFLPDCLSSRGQYDTEIVLRSVIVGSRIIEVPVKYVEVRKQKNFMFKKIFFNLIGFVKLWFRLRNLSVKGPIKYHRLDRDTLLNEVRDDSFTEIFEMSSSFYNQKKTVILKKLNGVDK